MTVLEFAASFASSGPQKLLLAVRYPLRLRSSSFREGYPHYGRNLSALLVRWRINDELL